MNFPNISNRSGLESTVRSSRFSGNGTIVAAAARTAALRARGLGLRLLTECARVCGLLLLCAFGTVLLPGCKEGKPPASPQAVPSKHEHKPPHGGTPVVLGEEEYHVELVLDAPTGKLQAFVMDGELENFVRIPAAAFQVLAKVSGQEETLTFSAVANNATGEKVGDTSLFEARADWLKTAGTFDAVIKEIEVRGKKYEDVSFNFPKGNDKDEK
jgi:hypothetical protein